MAPIGPSIWFPGSIDWHILLSLLGSLPGIAVGGHISVRISDRTPWLLLATVVVLVAAKLAFWDKESLSFRRKYNSKDD